MMTVISTRDVEDGFRDQISQGIVDTHFEKKRLKLSLLANLILGEEYPEEFILIQHLTVCPLPNLSSPTVTRKKFEKKMEGIKPEFRHHWHETHRHKHETHRHIHETHQHMHETDRHMHITRRHMHETCRHMHEAH